MRWLLLSTLLTLTWGLTAHAQADPPPQIDVVLADLSDRFGEAVTLEDLSAYNWEEQTFSSAALGCEQEGNLYAQVLVDGIRYSLVYEGNTYDYRVSADGNLVVACGEPTPVEAEPTATDTPPTPTATPTETLPTVQPAVVAMFPLSGPADETIRVIANQLPPETEMSVGISQLGSDVVLSQEIETSADGALYAELTPPEGAEPGSAWVVIITETDGVLTYRSPAYTVTTSDASP